MKIGYARVSSEGQNLERQLGALRAERCAKIFREKMTGSTTRNRPQLEKALDLLGKGDVFVVAEWDRATRSMSDGMALLERVLARGASIKILDKPHLNMSHTVERGLLALFSALAQDERERINKRANDGRRVAMARGKKMGRPQKLSDLQKAHALKLRKAGESCSDVGRLLNVSPSTIARLSNGRG